MSTEPEFVSRVPIVPTQKKRVRTCQPVDMLAIGKGDAGWGLATRDVGLWVHGHTKVEGEECPPLERVRRVIDSTPMLD